ncbi:hypothetical protein Hanom_Chr03g00242101 [Helianthus anomalus]
MASTQELNLPRYQSHQEIETCLKDFLTLYYEKLSSFITRQLPNPFGYRKNS